MAEDHSAERHELLVMIGALREHVRWQDQCGAVGLPTTGKIALRDREREPRHDSDRAPPRKPEPSPAPVHTPPPPVPEDAHTTETQTVPPERRDAELEQVRRKAHACTLCELHQHRKQAVVDRGAPTAELMLVGEGPGADEDALGEPFVGKAGQLLDRMIGAMGYERDDVYIANVVKCRPPKNRTPQLEEMAACLPFLHRQIEIVAPRVIIAMGGTAVRGLLGVSGGITRLRGKWKLYRGRIPVMPTYHPAYLLRQEGAKREVWNDLKVVLTELGRPIPPRGGSGRE